ncbi:MAG TPA: PQQ-dependent sugar dehydrogenase [Myxococcota bacterium]|nr:PQQ-dependent sugar dehydrogenase [Myxococcota bacterium]
MKLLHLCLATPLAVLWAATFARGQANPTFQLVTTAEAPSYLADPGDGRFFITQLDGHVRIFQNGTLQSDADAFLDLSSSVVFGAAGEGGMHSMAFDPSFSTNHFVYVEYTRQGSGDSALETVIERFTVDPNDPNHADLASAHIVLTQQSPPNHGDPGAFSNHKGGQLQFGPDGFLYFAFGDGGNANDPNCFSQKRDVLYGKMLRIDPSGDDFPGDPNENYAIPPSNPFVAGNDPNSPYRGEIYDLGLRNPYRFSFDRMTGAMWIADVGQDTREEVDLDSPPMTSGHGGLNFGWKVREGTTCHTPNPQAANCPAYVFDCNNFEDFTDPVNEYDHTVGQTIIGGYVYRGAANDWQGRYIFGDHGNSKIFALTKNGQTFTRTEIPAAGVTSPISFGEDHLGELYVLSQDGGVFKIRFDLPSGPSKDQKNCIGKLNDGFTNVADAESSLIRSCIDQFASGKLSTTVAACYVPNEKIAKLEGKNDTLDVDRCQVSPPPFGYNGTDAGNERATAVDEQTVLNVPLTFSPDAVILKANDKVGASCQKAVIKAAAACSKARREEFVRCKKAGLKLDSFTSSADLATCLGQDPKQRVLKACDSGGKLGAAITKSCVNKGVDLTTAFPGCAAADAATLSGCIDFSAKCQTCLLFKDADGLDVDCTPLCED